MKYLKMKKLLTILFLICPFAGFAQIGIVDYDTVQAKAIQADSALWLPHLEPQPPDTLLTRVDGKVGYVLKSDIKDSVFVTVTTDTLFIGNDTIINDIIANYDTTGFRLTIPQIIDLEDSLKNNTKYYFEKELSDSENNINVGFTLNNKSVIFFNGHAIPQTLWNGEGTATLSLNLDIKVYDKLIVKQ